MQNKIEETINNLKNGIDVRKQLISLRNDVRNETEYKNEDFIFLKEYLNHEDPKVRKNAALIIGELELDEVFDILFFTYLNEEQLFIRDSLLKALSYFDLSGKIDILEKRSVVLNALIHSDQSKHYLKEQRMIKSILHGYMQNKKHKFIGLDKDYTMILTTLRNHQEIVSDSLININTKKNSLGIAVKEKSLRYIMQNHCFRDILFPIIKTNSWDVEVLSDKIVSSALNQFLMKVHEGEETFRFRLVINSSHDVSIKKLCDLIETKSKSKLTNNPSDYEIELYIKESKANEALVYVKLMCINDFRFAYREQFLATSINPVVAATIMQYIVPYIKENSDVLDPFCGVGTMLIERNYIENTHFMMGVDYYGEAINKAKRNTQLANCQIHYVQRDIVTFAHQHLFDEIITNMPSHSRAMELENTYDGFFKKMIQLLIDGGYAFLHTSEIGLIKKNLKKYKSYFNLVDEIAILKGNKQTTCLFIIQKNQN